ncbi:hypothetical protein DY037_05610 [Apilactobacillus micheneri]|uniref:hypothetical protein n=1 Tax=Apilactobacillus micheneri TaxID=1899430 RepID=UPI001126AAB8|nr:hypothetical protein [Apilactobacillus micheneri]TPR49258.1 hypothetical protein DY037_05610 [Apilactobacillus micheneri]
MDILSKMMKNVGIKKENMEDITQECVQAYSEVIMNDFQNLPGFIESNNYDSLMASVLAEVISPIDEDAVNDRDVFQVETNQELKQLMDDEVKYGKLKIYKVNLDLSNLSLDELVNNHIVTQVNMDFDRTYNDYFIYVEE